MTIYDIALCSGENCARREQCYRYRELLRYRADNDPDKPTYIIMTQQTNPDKCALFWDEKGDEQ